MIIEFLLNHTPLLYFTQSLWRDEAFSILAAEQPLATILPKLTFEPPLYYTLLHFWIKMFGRSEIATRSLSLLGFSLATLVVIYWAEKLFKKHWLSWFTPLFFFLNPMLLYYAFEVRTYGWYIFFGTLSFYAYANNKWLLYVLAAVGGFYTHSYMVFFLFAQGIHWIFTNTKQLVSGNVGSFLRHNQGAHAFIAIVLCLLPWIARIVKESQKLKNSWYYPVDVHLIRSVLGNMFFGYEGTPGYLWGGTSFVSLIFLGLFALSLMRPKIRERNIFFLLMTLVPLALVIGVSFVKPIFVNRYLIPVAIAEVFLLAGAIEAIQRKWLQRVLAGVLLLGVIAFNLWYPDKHAKLNIRATIAQINLLRTPQDLTLASSSLVFFETLYYSNDPTKVFFYNPNGSGFPWYVGDAIVSPAQMVREFPTYPVRAFLVKEDGSYEIVYHMQVTTRSLPTKTL